MIGNDLLVYWFYYLFSHLTFRLVNRRMKSANDWLTPEYWESGMDLEECWMVWNGCQSGSAWL